MEFVLPVDATLTEALGGMYVEISSRVTKRRCFCTGLHGDSGKNRASQGIYTNRSADALPTKGYD